MVVTRLTLRHGHATIDRKIAEEIIDHRSASQRTRLKSTFTMGILKTKNEIVPIILLLLLMFSGMLNEFLEIAYVPIISIINTYKFTIILR
jgi:hypothetical protein